MSLMINGRSKPGAIDAYFRDNPSLVGTRDQDAISRKRPQSCGDGERRDSARAGKTGDRQRRGCRERRTRGMKWTVVFRSVSKVAKDLSGVYMVLLPPETM
jgi:hypothetical protein